VPRLLFLRVCVFLFLVVLDSAANAQSPQTSVAPAIDESQRVVLHGTVHPLAQPQNDQGRVPDSFPAERMVLMLQRSPEREQALQKFLRDVHTQGSPRFHHWVTPAEFGVQFGANDADITTISNWLQSHGFRIGKLHGNKIHLEFSGTAAQVREALRTEIHEYNVEGNTYYAIANEISIPQQIATLIRGFAPLNTFPLQSYVHVAGSGILSGPGHMVTPQFTLTENGKPFYAIAPEDFATQYNVTPLYTAGLDGTGQTIGILGENNIDLNLVSAYRQLFGLAGNNTQVVIDGEDPGDGFSPNIEGFLDVEVSGAVAPKATVNFYIAGGTFFQGYLVLATMRALEDNQASVLSASFGECEPLLGNAGNQLWSGFWEQAAAQGQTVLVSSGDSGPATCPVVLVLQSGNLQTVDFGLTVNGLASTPWNIAVGGTDFYYSDYSIGAPSITNDWNQTNDSSNGSLKAPLSEQPWDNSLGLNAAATGGLIHVLSDTGAAGGGPSSCSSSTGILTTGITCVSGYPKPAWQNASGVPSDGVRDLPDVSFFAASGENFSAYAICAAALDCASSATAPQLTLVGGTSASAPAMAGIMALVNQKYGRQGQANFTIYALANQQSAIFHDITIGTNDLVCPQPTPSICTTPIPGVTGLFSYGVYAAGPGYDMASGIGSFDTNALVNSWNKITYQSSDTSLQISPSSITHGSPVNVSTTVKAASGTSVPTGDVDIQISGYPQLPQQSGVLQLTSGTASGSISTFPGGTYQVAAQYSGDGVFAPSISAGSTLTVTPEPSVLQFDARYQALTEIPNGGQAPFGSNWTVEAQPTGQTSGSTTPGTGTVTFIDGATSVTVPLNSSGVATWSPHDLAIGQHSISASYSGDSSYNASTAGPLTFTVTKGNPLLTVIPQAEATVPLGSNPPTVTYPAGTSFNVYVVSNLSNSLTPPTGMVSVTLGSTTVTATLNPSQFLNRASASVLVTFPSVPVGTYSLSLSYAGDSNWNSTSFTYPQQFTFAAQQISPSTVSLTVSPSTVNSGQAATFTATVQSQSGSTAPFGPVILYANGSQFSAFFVAPSPLGSTSAAGSVTVSGSSLPSGNVQVTALFEGSPNFAPSTSAPVSLTVNPTNFQMNLGAASVAIKSGSTGSVPLQLTGPSGGTVALQLACVPSSSSFGCSINPSSSSVNGSLTATLTINAYVMSSTTAFAHPSHSVRVYSTAAVGFVVGFAFLLFTPRKRIRSALLMICAISAMTLTVGSCGGGGSSAPPPPPPPQQINTPAGTYFVVVTGNSPSNAHNVKLTVEVQ
jgi:subtilase family serine protease